MRRLCDPEPSNFKSDSLLFLQEEKTRWVLLLYLAIHRMTFYDTKSGMKPSGITPEWWLISSLLLLTHMIIGRFVCSRKRTS